MASVLVRNLTRPLACPLRVAWCDSFLCQLRGLMMAPPLQQEAGLLLVQKSESRTGAAIHMLFMRMNLAVVWVDQAGMVVDRRLAKRWRPVYVPVSPAKYVLEISTERLSEFRAGDRLRFEETDLV